MFLMMLALLAAAATSLSAQTLGSGRRVNIPYLGTGSDFAPAIFWFGRVDGTINYADVRAWYRDGQLEVVVHIPDRELWYNPSPSQTLSQLTASDAVSVFLDLGGNSGGTPRPTSYRFVKQLSSAAAAFRGTGNDWASDPAPFTTTDGWRGTALNNPTWDVGWSVRFTIPFSSLGLTGPPAEGTRWGVAVVVHDRDDQAGTPVPDQVWPENMDQLRPLTWAQLQFGRPSHTPPTSSVTGSTLVRHGLNGAVVSDAAVGGHSVCGDGLNAWTEWGHANYAGYDQFNIQNQWDVADFMCFSKYYVTFPLTNLPSGKGIIAAQVTLHLFGNAGYTPTDATPSAIHALTVAEDWTESGITWNNAPYATENISVTTVYPVSAEHPAGPYTWDVSYAVAEAYRLGQPLRLVFYSTDGDYHSGKYFYTSDSDDWSGTIRPALDVQWGDTSATPPSPPTGFRVAPVQP